MRIAVLHVEAASPSQGAEIAARLRATVRKADIVGRYRQIYAQVLDRSLAAR